MIIITGSEGYIGKNLKEYLQDRVDLLFIDKKIGRPVESITQEEMNKTSFVIHLSANSNIAEMEKDRSLVVENIKSTLYLVDLIKKVNGLKPYLLFASSSAVHYPSTLYSRAKYFEELVCRGVSCSIFRFYNIVGGIPDESQNDHILPNLFRSVKSGSPFQIYGDGKNRREYVYIDDLLRLLVDEIGYPKYKGRFCEVSANRSHSVREVIAEAERVLRRKIKVEYRSARQGDVQQIKSPMFSLKMESGLIRALKDYQREYSL